MVREIENIIEQFGLIPLDEEGGYFRRVLETPHYDSVASVIYYLMTKDSFSALHLLSIHEIWTFISGDPIEQIVIDENKRVTISTIGLIGTDSGVSHIPPYVWQASRIKKGGSFGYALCTTTCIPEYHQEHFTLAKRETLASIVDPQDRLMVSEFLAPDMKGGRDGFTT